MALGDLSHPLDSFFGNGSALKLAAAERRKRRIMAAAAVVVMIPAINSTMAGDISLGSTDIEFGQGTAATSACDNSITIDLPSQLVTNYFELEKIVLSDVDLTACNGKTLHIDAFDSANQAIQLEQGANYASYEVTGSSSTPIDIAVISGINVETIARVAVSTQ
jgi:hypothetical protein